MKLAFVFIAEAYQVYHAAAVLFELMRREGVSVDVFHIDPAVPYHLQKLAQVHGVAQVSSEHLEANFVGKAIQTVRILGLAKPQVLKKHDRRLAQYDAVISTEDGIVDLFNDIPAVQRPKRILITHGAAQRSVPSVRQRDKCDLILVKGPADIDAYILAGCKEPDRMVSVGYPKFVSVRLLSKNGAAYFDNDNPVVLYNPHKERKQRSWDIFFEPLMAGFHSDTSMNLIVSPHVKLLRRRTQHHRNKLSARSTANVFIDTGSERALNNSYSEIADIYVGDVSSQVFEFLYRPRPCVFLNAHAADWRNDHHYGFWQLGEVVDTPAQVMPAIRRAQQEHYKYCDKQIEFASAALGDTTERSVTDSADIIEQFVRTGQILR